jgi:hypothetical protein
MIKTLVNSPEAQLNSEIAAADAASSGSFVIDLPQTIIETANLTAIDLQAGVTLTIDGSDGSGGFFALDGAGSFDGVLIDAGGAGSSVILENLQISNVPSAHPAVLAAGTLAGTVTFASSATVDQTGDVTFGTVGAPATVTNNGTFEVDQLVAGATGPAIRGAAGSVFDNAGTMVKLANADDNSGISEIYVDVTDTGTLSNVDVNSNFRFDGASNSFSGLYLGSGMFDYGDPATFQTVGNGSYSVNVLGNIDMANGACTTTGALVDQNGSIITSTFTSITNFGTWNVTSDNGITLENPSQTSTSGARFDLMNNGVLAKTGGTGTTQLGINFDPNAGPGQDQGGTVDIVTGTLAFDGFVNNFHSEVTGAGVLAIGGGGTDSIGNGTTVSAGGWIIKDAGTDVTLDVPLTYTGAFDLQSGTTLTLTTSNNLTLSHATFDGTVTGSGAAIVLASGGTLSINDLTSANGSSQVQNFNVPISGFTSGDTLRLEGFGNFATINGVTPNFNASTNTTALTLTDSGATVATLNLVGDYAHPSVAPDPQVSGAVDVMCYAAGTRLLTVTGERPVESLEEGDLVVTLAGEQRIPRPVRWIGRRRVDLIAHPRPDTAAPIRVRRGAIADGTPHSDLLVSPDHAILVEGVLICARQLVNGTTILRETGCRAVEYFHVELEEHAILLAEGLPAESYLDTGNRGFFANADAPLVLHPDLTDETGYPTREANSCVPFVSDEGRVRPVWRRLAERAEAAGLTLPRPETTTDPAPALIMDGRHVAPLHAEGGAWLFVLPSGTEVVRLVSRDAVPTDARPWLTDRRRLGLCVERIVVRDGLGTREVPADHPGLSRGWWQAEGDLGAPCRWTDGDAVLPLPATDGPIMLEIRASIGDLVYLVQRDREARAA